MPTTKQSPCEQYSEVDVITYSSPVEVEVDAHTGRLEFFFIIVFEINYILLKSARSERVHAAAWERHETEAGIEPTTQNPS